MDLRNRGGGLGREYQALESYPPETSGASPYIVRERRDSISDDPTRERRGSSWNSGIVLCMSLLILILFALTIWLVTRDGQNNRDDGPWKPWLWDGDYTSMPGYRDSWKFNGKDLNDTRWAWREKRISRKAVVDGKVGVLWSFNASGDVDAAPTVSSDGMVYFCTMKPDGRVFGVNAYTGDLVWTKHVSHYTGNSASSCRVSPAIWNHLIVVGDQMSGKLIGINRWTGETEWVTLIHPHFAAIITQSPIIAPDGRGFVGVSSREEALCEYSPNYPCATFIGRMVMFEASTGAVLRTFSTLPDNGGQVGGYAGGAIWGSTPALDLKRNIVYFATGNAYRLPPLVQACVNASEEAQTSNSHCREPLDYTNSVVALSALDFSFIWSFNASGIDAWTVSCLAGPLANHPENCPPHPGPDWDFQEGPTLTWGYSTKLGRYTRMLSVGQKSGIFWVLRASNGELLHSTALAQGSSLGGIGWGHAADHNHYYVPISNAQFDNFTLLNGKVACGGGWASVRKRDGKIEWITPEPGSLVGASECNADYSVRSSYNSRAFGPVALVNTGDEAVVFGTSTSGKMYILCADTGKVLFEFDAGASIHGGVSVAGGIAYLGSGYRNFNIGTPGSTVYAFGLMPNVIV